MRQIGLAIQMFADTRGGRFPWTVHASLSESWVQTLKPFTESVDEIRICPSDPKRNEWLNGSRRGTSYVINEYVANPAVEESVEKFQQVQETSKLIILFEGSVARNEFGDHVHCSQFYTPLKVAKGWVWDRMLQEIDPQRHSGSANYLYADGHVVSIPAATLQQWVDDDIANKTNFARPVR